MIKKHLYSVGFLIVGLIVVVAIILSAHPIRRTPAPLVYVHTQAPANPYITPAQKFLFENRLSTTSTSAEIQNYLTVATKSAVATDEVRVDDSCRPETVVVKTRSDASVSFTNTSAKPQSLTFGKIKVQLVPGQKKTLKIADIYPINPSQKSISVKSYACENMPELAGFVVIYPPASDVK